MFENGKYDNSHIILAYPINYIFYRRILMKLALMGVAFWPTLISMLFQ